LISEKSELAYPDPFFTVWRSHGFGQTVMDNDFRIRILLSLQAALLGQVSANMRAVPLQPCLIGTFLPTAGSTTRRQLGAPSEAEDIVSDYNAAGLTLGRHPLSLLRPTLLENCDSCLLPRFGVIETVDLHAAAGSSR